MSAADQVVGEVCFEGDDRVLVSILMEHVPAEHTQLVIDAISAVLSAA